MHKDFEVIYFRAFCPICNKIRLFKCLLDMPYLAYCDQCGSVHVVSKLTRAGEIENEEKPTEPIKWGESIGMRTAQTLRDLGWRDPNEEEEIKTDKIRLEGKIRLRDLVMCENLPIWAKWAAQDLDGHIWVYETKPDWDAESEQWSVLETVRARCLGDFLLAEDWGEPFKIESRSAGKGGESA